VKNWTKRNVYKNSIFQCQALFFPCNIGGEHWILIVSYLEEKSIQVFDSLFGSHGARVIAIFNYLKDAYRATYPGSELPDQKTWRLYATNNHCPGQTNFYDCGVFVCMYADYIANGWPLIFNQTHINRCRERIALGCMQNCAVTTIGCNIMLNEIWGMRYNIIFAVQNYRDKFLSFLEKGDLPETKTMGFY